MCIAPYKQQYKVHNVVEEHSRTSKSQTLEWKKAGTFSSTSFMQYSFRNEFRSRMKFVLHSHDKLNWLSVLARVIYSPNQLRMRSYPQTKRFMIFNPEESSVSVYVIPE